MNLRTQRYLGHREPGKYGLRGHKDVHSILKDVLIPVLPHPMFQQSFGNGEVSSDRLANITAQHAVKERIAQVVGDGSIVLITAVQRG